jgi:hypothetical protein
VGVTRGWFPRWDGWCVPSGNERRHPWLGHGQRQHVSFLGRNEPPVLPGALPYRPLATPAASHGVTRTLTTTRGCCEPSLCVCSPCRPLRFSRRDAAGGTHRYEPLHSSPALVAADLYHDPRSR